MTHPIAGCIPDSKSNALDDLAIGDRAWICSQELSNQSIALKENKGDEETVTGDMRG